MSSAYTVLLLLCCFADCLLLLTAVVVFLRGHVSHEQVGTRTYNTSSITVLVMLLYEQIPVDNGTFKLTQEGKRQGNQMKNAYRYSPCVLSSFLRCWWWLLLFSLLFLPFFDFDSDIVCFILSFSCGNYAVASVSVCAATRLAYDLYLNTYVRWSHLSIFVWAIRFVPVIACIILCDYLFSSWGNLPLQSYWSLSCDHGLHCSDELMWEQQKQWTRCLMIVLETMESAFRVTSWSTL